jgi:murein DD-endopeptidase MepM/ murein hydrolase activator NlpD
MALLVPAVPSAGVAASPVASPVRAPASVDGTDPSDTAAEQAAREIADARDRANAAADALFQAESDLDALQVEQQRLENDIAVLQAQIDALRDTVEAVAINRFTRAGTDSMPLLTGFRTAGEQAQVDVLIDVVNETSAEDFDQFDALNNDLVDARAELERAEAAGEAARAELERRREVALAEVERLKEVEEQRLKDEAVRRALEIEEAERRRQEEEAADALRAQAAALDPLGRQTQASTVPDPASGTGSGGGAAGSDDPLIVGDGDIDEPLPIGPVSSGGAGGGLTGTLGPGGRPGSDPGVLGGAGWLCPVQGPVSFGDTWGAPRSGGRSHQGVDMIGDRGLPIVAVVDGFAQAKVNVLGGNTVSLSGADGNRYYFAHLDTWGALGQVTAGTVIGYLGDTGNAKFSVPHLHLQIHPGGGAAVNPYPTVRAFC